MAIKDPFARKRAEAVDDSKLGELARYANLMKQHQSKVESLEEELTRAKKALQQIEEEAIPSFMQELGLSEIKLLDGSKIGLTTTIYCSITEANHAAAMDWIVRNGHEDIIKLTVSGSFGKDEYKLAKTIYEKLKKEGANVASKEGVHPSTLRAFLKEQLEKGANVPLETFSARPITKAKLTGA